MVGEGGREGSKSSLQDPEGREALNWVGTVGSHLHSCKEHKIPQTQACCPGKSLVNPKDMTVPLNIGILKLHNLPKLT